jgi:two-component system sensor histidine kinase PilS (NtrC family)
MLAATQPTSPRDPDLAKSVLRLLGVYRLLIPALVLLLFLLGRDSHLVGSVFPRLLLVTTVAYFFAALLLPNLLRHSKTTHANAMPVALDGVALCLITVASGGVESGLPLLALVPLGGLALLTNFRISLLVAALGALLLLLQQSLLFVLDIADSAGAIAQTGYYGATYFLVTGSGAALGRRLRETQALVEQRDLDVANLAELSEYIVQHLRESLLVIDADDRIRLLNTSARHLLMATAQPGDPLAQVSPALAGLLARWRAHDEGAALSGPATLTGVDGIQELEAHFAALGRQRPAPVLVFLEDLSQLAVRVQQSKLAALGRLSASIAHEIRNPVGAMSHAAQLLAESPTLTAEDRRLTQIMVTHGQRVSQIVTSVLALSRREQVAPQRLMLGDWLAQFVEEFAVTLQWSTENLRVIGPAAPIEIRVDPNHLRQLVWNLTENAVQMTHESAAPVELRYGRLPGGRPYLDIADRGPGVPTVDIERLFEPFFSRRPGGTGLGLFIARELAGCNGASLRYEPRAGGGSLFHVIFADPQRWEA